MTSLPLIEAPALGLTDAERDLACRDMLDPYFAALANAAIQEGWQPAEVAAALLGHAVDATRAGVGDDAAIASLEGVVTWLKSELTPKTPKQ